MKPTPGPDEEEKEPRPDEETDSDDLKAGEGDPAEELVIRKQFFNAIRERFSYSLIVLAIVAVPIAAYRENAPLCSGRTSTCASLTAAAMIASKMTLASGLGALSQTDNAGLKIASITKPPTIAMIDI